MKNIHISTLTFSIIAIITVVAVYSHVLQGPFVFDDKPNILENPYIQITDLKPKTLLQAAFKSPIPRRPIANITFALNYYFDGYNPIGYHVINIIIHIINGILLFVIIRETLWLQNYQYITLVAALIALSWLLHPIQTQSISYIVQRMNCIAAMFYMLALLMYMNYKQKLLRRYLIVGVLSGIMSLGCKEIAATLPIFIILYEWYFYQNLNRVWITKWLLPLSAMLLAIVIGMIGAERLYGIITTIPWTRLLTECRVVVFYISLLLFPHPSRLSLDHDFTASTGILSPPSTLISMVLILAMVGFAVVSARKHRLLSFCILWYFGNLVIESSILRLELLFEHRNYLPSMFGIAGVVSVLFKADNEHDKHKH